MSAARFSLNQITIDQWSLEQAAGACGKAGVGWIGAWRHKVDETGVAAAARTIQAAGVRVSSLCRGGFFCASPGERAAVDADNRRAVEEAAALGTDVLVLVCGPPRDRDLAAARAAVRSGIERLLPYAIDHGVRLGIEPLHPMMLGARSVVASLGEANDHVEAIGSDHVGVVVDAYHVFWDAHVEQEMARAAGHVLGFHVSDWVTPVGDVLASRAMMGDGIIDLRRLRRLADAAGFDGPIEVEVINAGFRERDGAELLDLALERFGSELWD